MVIKVKNSGVVQLDARKDSRRGDLFVAEGAKNIPFEIRRVYFVNNIKDAEVARGGHAHKKTRQVIFCANGSFTLHLDDGRRKQKIVLKTPKTGVVLGPKLWHTMSDFSKDCVILVFASDYYRESDYMRSYDDFQKMVRSS